MPVAMIDEIRDAGPLAVDDETIAFEDDDRSDHDPTACMPWPHPTANTFIGCRKNS